jgi:hypothetical protein
VTLKAGAFEAEFVDEASLQNALEDNATKHEVKK